MIRTRGGRLLRNALILFSLLCLSFMGCVNQHPENAGGYGNGSGTECRKETFGAGMERFYGDSGTENTEGAATAVELAGNKVRALSGEPRIVATSASVAEICEKLRLPLVGVPDTTVAAFTLIVIFLMVLFFAAINIGTLRVSMGELFAGLFLRYNRDVATIYDLRFPRIIISILAGAAIAVSGVMFQAVLKNPLADPGIIGDLRGSQLFLDPCDCLFSDALFLYAAFCLYGRLPCLSAGLQPFLEGRAQSPAHYPCGYRGGSDVFRDVDRAELCDRERDIGRCIHCQRKHRDEDLE